MEVGYLKGVGLATGSEHLFSWFSSRSLFLFRKGYWSGILFQVVFFRSIIILDSTGCYGRFGSYQYWHGI